MPEDKFLSVLEKRFEGIKIGPKYLRKSRSERLMQDIERIYNMPRHVCPVFEKDHPDVVKLYEDVNMEAI